MVKKKEDYVIFLESNQLTTFIQHQVVMVAELLWSTGHKNVLITKEILQTCHLGMKAQTNKRDHLLWSPLLSKDTNSSNTTAFCSQVSEHYVQEQLIHLLREKC